MKHPHNMLTFKDIHRGIKISTMNRGKTWKFQSDEMLEKVRELLLQIGGEEVDVSADFELWRIKLGNATFTAYNTLKLYATPSNNPAVLDAINKIDSVAGDFFVPPDADYLIGCDEAGKGEVLGSIFVTCTFMPAHLFKSLQDVLRTVDTKARRHPFDYWKTLFEELHAFKPQGFDAVIKKIRAQTVDAININKIMDKAYGMALARIFELHNPQSFRIVIDDYGVGDELKDKLNELDGKVIIEHRADEKYLEVVAASVISKYFREKEMMELNSDEKWSVEGVTPGPGSANNQQTLEWLELWSRSGRPWPPFVRKSYRTIKEIEERLRKQ